MRIVIEDITRSRNQVYFWITGRMSDLHDRGDFIIRGIYDTSQEATDVIDRLHMEEEANATLPGT